VELEHRVEMLECEVKVLKEDIRKALLDVRDSLPEKPISPSQWRKKAWVLALLNVLLAIALFTNIHLYVSDTPLGISSTLASWLQAFWVALTFVWLILQMYPLALLLDQEGKQSREVAWHNAASLFIFNPGLTIALTMLVLVVAIISILFPALWFVVTAALLAVVCLNVVGYLLRLRQERTRAGETG
jgi:hypothetical protein